MNFQWSPNVPNKSYRSFMIAPPISTTSFCITLSFVHLTTATQDFLPFLEFANLFPTGEPLYMLFLLLPLMAEMTTTATLPFFSNRNPKFWLVLAQPTYTNPTIFQHPSWLGAAMWLGSDEWNVSSMRAVYYIFLFTQLLA